MNPGYRHELLRTASLRIAIVLGILLAMAGVVSLVAAPSAATPPEIATAYYYDGTAYHLLGFVYDGNGHPIPHLTLDLSSRVGIPPGTILSVTTNAAGVVDLSFPEPRGNYTYTLTATTTGGTTAVTTELTDWPYPAPNGIVEPGFGDIVPLRTGTYTSVGTLLAFFAGPNGSAPTGFHLQYAFATFDLELQGPSPAANSTGPENYSVGPFESYSIVSPLRLPTPPPGEGPDIVVQIVDPSGTVVADAIFPPIDFGPQTSAPPAARGTELALSEIGLTSLVAGLLGGISVYGADRLSGVLEPYLVRRVSPEGLLLARYGGAYLTMAVGLILGVAALDAGLQLRYGAPMPTGLLLIALGSSLASLAAWLALPFAVAHLARTPLRLTTAAIAALVVFGFVWTPALVALAPPLGAGPGTVYAATLTFDANVVNAALAASTLVPVGLSGTDAATALGVVVVALLWVAVPLGVAIWRARTAD